LPFPFALDGTEKKTAKPASHFRDRIPPLSDPTRTIVLVVVVGRGRPVVVGLPNRGRPRGKTPESPARPRDRGRFAGWESNRGRRNDDDHEDEDEGWRRRRMRGGSPRAGRVRLRPNRGFPLGLARQHHPPQLWRPRLYDWSTNRPKNFLGVTSQCRITRKAPVRTEPHPTCADTPTRRNVSPKPSAGAG
jgi:hypothetical protein